MSYKEIKIPIKIGTFKSHMWVSLVNANIPLLIGNDYLRKWKAVQDHELGTLHLKVKL